MNQRKEKYLKYLQSEEWEQIRIDLHILRNSKCERCGSTHHLQVHHLTYKNLFNEELEDLELLCGGCHKAEHFGIKKKKKKPKVKLKKKKKKKRTKYGWAEKTSTQKRRNKLKELGYKLN